MTVIGNYGKALVALLHVIILTYSAVTNSASEVEDNISIVAFPDKYMIRLGAYFVENSNTQFGVSSDVGGLGTLIDYQRDLGGKSGDTTPQDRCLFQV